MSALPSVRPGLARHRMDHQVVVYNPSDESVHLLDPTTACVLDVLEERPAELSGLQHEVASRMGGVATTELLLLALEELRQADLVDSASEEPTRMTDLSRREIVRKAVAAGIAVMMIPAIASLSPSALNAQTVSPNNNACTAINKRPNGCPCGNNGDCLNRCVSGTCQT